MSWLMAAVYERSCMAAEKAGLSGWRARLLSALEGSVLEVGTGTGLNLPHYPKAVTRLVLSEPDKHMRSALKRKRGAQLVGEVVQYEDSYRLCYIRGPEGLLIGLAQETSNR